MKKIIAIIFVIIFMFSGCSVIKSINKNDDNNTHNSTSVKVEKTKKIVKSVWMTYYDLQKFTKDKNEKNFTNKIKQTFKQLQSIGFNTVTVQVRPCADAFYNSYYFPSSAYCFSKQGADMPYDPLKIICEVANNYNLKIEAWINPYRISQTNKINDLCDENIAKKWYNNKSTKSYVYISKSGIYFNPSVSQVNDLIVNGVKEIVQNYPIKSIHFDDYFYPTTNEDIDKLQYKQYKEDSGKLSLSDWRRDNVNNMVKRVYNTIKSVNKDVLFGISPASNINEDYSNLYADVYKWCNEDGFIDYICPQIYFGFKNDVQPFMITTKKWISISKKPLYIGLPLYKSNAKDKYASLNNKDAINEFINNQNIIARQITYINKIDKISGFYIFSLGNLFDDNCKEETQNLVKVMQDNNQN